MRSIGVAALEQTRPDMKRSQTIRRINAIEATLAKCNARPSAEMINLSEIFDRMNDQSTTIDEAIQLFDAVRLGNFVNDRARPSEDPGLSKEEAFNRALAEFDAIRAPRSSSS